MKISFLQFFAVLEKKFLPFLQETGETIFVPSGWFHQVANLEETCSVGLKNIFSSILRCIFKLVKFFEPFCS